VAVIAGGSVDENGGGAEGRFEVGERLLELVDVTEVALLEGDGGALGGEFGGEGFGVGDIEIEKADAGLLGGEGADDFSADAGGAAGDVDGGALEAGVGGEVHWATPGARSTVPRSIAL
jgi:hypothetical protein